MICQREKFDELSFFDQMHNEYMTGPARRLYDIIDNYIGYFDGNPDGLAAERHITFYLGKFGVHNGRDFIASWPHTRRLLMLDAFGVTAWGYADLRARRN